MCSCRGLVIIHYHFRILYPFNQLISTSYLDLSITMSLKLYGHPQSICTKRVRTVLEEKKLQYEFIVVDFLKGEHLSEPYGVDFHPFKKIPVLIDEESDVKIFGKATNELAV